MSFGHKKRVVLGLVAFCFGAGAACLGPQDVQTQRETAEPSSEVTEESSLVDVDADHLGREVSSPVRLADGDEYRLKIRALIAHGSKLFSAVWTPQEGGGRPLTKGNGNPLADLSDPLIFPRNFNRISAMDSNSCASCHNTPFPGGGGHFTANAFIPGQRFDFLTFDRNDLLKGKGNLDERGMPTNLITFGKSDGATNSRATIGMFGAGYIEMLSRQITTELQAIRDSIPAGGSKVLSSKGVQYGKLSRDAAGNWNMNLVEGITKQSLHSTGPADPPSLIIRPFHQQSLVVSIREFTNNAMNHHHGIQTTERFGANTDPDGDNFRDEMSRADVTATSIFQATLPVPGRVIPRHPKVEKAVLNGEAKFAQIGCVNCHRATLPLDKQGWVYSEPNPFNPPKNLQTKDAEPVSVDLTGPGVPEPKLSVKNGVVEVPAYTDLKLHNISTGPNDGNCDPIDMSEDSTVGMGAPNPAFFAGTCMFLTKKLWGAANEPPFFHHGKFTTLREAILAHAGEASNVTTAYKAMAKGDQDSVIEFLKTLQVLPAGTKALVVDERGRPREWPPRDNY